MSKFEKPKSLDSFINMEEDSGDHKKDWVHFTLRIRRDLLQEIDKILEKRIGITKTGWILQAIQDKLEEGK